MLTLGIKMYGVVLWSDKNEQKAVIWCEDHGDLAFYCGGEESVFDGPSLDAGDLVQFQLSEGRDVRFATEPRLVAEQQYRGLAESLKLDGAVIPKQVVPEARNEGNIIPFTPRRDKALLAS